jgi:polyisoprenoid-binding protein YceI
MTTRLLCVTAALALLTGTLAAADYALTGANTSITFVGSKPGGKHDGGFKGVTGTASVPGDDLTKLKISLDIDLNTLYSDNPKLTNHLKSPDFFGVKSNPSSKFVSTKVEKSGADYKITGELTMCGQTKSITFPAQIAVKGDMLTVASKFTIDRTQWGMTYGRGKINDDVTLTVSLKATK